MTFVASSLLTILPVITYHSNAARKARIIKHWRALEAERLSRSHTTRTVSAPPRTVPRQRSRSNSHVALSVPVYLDSISWLSRWRVINDYSMIMFTPLSLLHSNRSQLYEKGKKGKRDIRNVNNSPRESYCLPSKGNSRRVSCFASFMKWQLL